MISYLLVVEQHRTQIVIHALLKCQQENLYHEQNVTRSEERFSRNAETDLVCRLLLEKKKKNLQSSKKEYKIKGARHEVTIARMSAIIRAPSTLASTIHAS